MGIEAALIGGGLGLIGSSMQQDAAESVGQSQADAARIAAEASAFRPTGITTRFGKSGFNYDAQGNLQGAGYQVAPDLAAMREGMMGFAGGSLSQVQSARQLQPYLESDATKAYMLGTSLLPKDMTLESSPESYLYSQQLRQQADLAMPTNYNAQATGEAQGLYNQLSGMANQVMPSSYDPTARAQQYMQQQQGLLAPGREQQLAKTRNDLQQSGRAGLAFGATQAGGMAATNPEMAAYYNSIAQQDSQLAANAQTVARGELQSDINLAQGLGTTGLNTLQQSQQQQLQNALTKGQYASGLSGTALTAQQYADQLARQNRQGDINTGLGLMGSGINTISQGYGLQTAALQPWQQYLQGAATVEGLGQGSLDMASALGAKTSTAGANQAQYLAKTGMPYTGSAIGSGLMGLANNQQFTNAAGNWLSGTGASANPYSIAPTATNLTSMGGGQGLSFKSGTR